MIAYGYQGGPHMLLDALILAAALLFVFGLGWYTGRRTNPGAPLGRGIEHPYDGGLTKAEPGAPARALTGSLTTPSDNAEEVAP